MTEPYYKEPLIQNQNTYPQQPYGQPQYQHPGYPQAAPYQPYQPATTTTVVVASHPEEDNFCFGCCMGWLFGIFGLFCLLCVRDKGSYIKGWLVPFIISLVVLIVLLVLIFATSLIIPHEITHDISFA